MTSGHDVPENEPDLVVNEVRHHLRGEVNACIATATTTSCVAVAYVLSDDPAACADSLASRMRTASRCGRPRSAAGSLSPK